MQTLNPTRVFLESEILLSYISQANAFWHGERKFLEEENDLVEIENCLVDCLINLPIKLFKAC